MSAIVHCLASRDHVQSSLARAVAHKTCVIAARCRVETTLDRTQAGRDIDNPWRADRLLQQRSERLDCEYRASAVGLKSPI